MAASFSQATGALCQARPRLLGGPQAARPALLRVSSSRTAATSSGGEENREEAHKPASELHALLETMSIVWLQVGQCGNQIGQEWWQIVTGNAAETDRYPFFSRDGLINAICVDSESKVIRRLRQNVRKGYFRDSNIIVGKGGRGNNWAYGYRDAGTGSESSLLERTMESFRLEVERRDCYSGTVMLHSLCGGTGSGLGSRLCEEIRDRYPAGYILSVTSAPHEAGDTPLQHYNSLLCLSSLYRHSDAVLLFQNDEVMKRAPSVGDRKQLSSDLQLAVSLGAMNSHIASCLAGLLYPVHSLKTRSSVSLGLEPWELIRSLCPMPSMKFLHTSQVRTRGTVFWDKVTSSVVQSIPRTDPWGRLHQSLSLLAVARSPQEYSFLLSQDAVLTKLKQTYRCVSWNPAPIHCWTDPQNILDPACHAHSLTVCANHSSAADLLGGVRSKARAMYESGAYLHWYRRYGCEDQDFRDAFSFVGGAAEEYDSLARQ